MGADQSIPQSGQPKKERQQSNNWLCYQYSQSSRKPPTNPNFMQKIVDVQPQIQLDEAPKKNWAPEFPNDMETVVQVPFRKPLTNSNFLLKIVDEQQQIQLDDEICKRNWASEFLNDIETVIHVPCNPGDNYMKISGEFFPKQIYKLDEKVTTRQIYKLDEKTNILQKSPSFVKSPTPSKSKLPQVSQISHVKQNSSLKRPKQVGFFKKDKENIGSKRWVK